jgi:hypothetical protein
MKILSQDNRCPSRYPYVNPLGIAETSFIGKCITKYKERISNSVRYMLSVFHTQLLVASVISCGLSNRHVGK